MVSTSDKKTQQVVWDVWTNSVAGEHYMDHWQESTDRQQHYLEEVQTSAT